MGFHRILGNASDLCEVRELLGKINLVNISFSKDLHLSPLYW